MFFVEAHLQAWKECRGVCGEGGGGAHMYLSQNDHRVAALIILRHVLWGRQYFSSTSVRGRFKGQNFSAAHLTPGSIVQTGRSPGGSLGEDPGAGWGRGVKQMHGRSPMVSSKGGESLGAQCAHPIKTCGR